VPDYFAIRIDLRGRRCLVVGGGWAAEQTARALLDCRADVHLVSLSLTSGLFGLAERGLIRYWPRRFFRSDVRGCTLVIAASDERFWDNEVARAARRHGVLLSVVDSPEQSDFTFTSLLRLRNATSPTSNNAGDAMVGTTAHQRPEISLDHEPIPPVVRLGRSALAPRRAGLGRLQVRIAPADRVVSLAVVQQTIKRAREDNVSPRRRSDEPLA